MNFIFLTRLLLCLKALNLLQWDQLYTSESIHEKNSENRDKVHKSEKG